MKNMIVSYGLLGEGGVMDKAMNDSCEIDLYIRDTGPLTEEEFMDMISYDNDEIPIDDLNFELIAV
jgi:hypothetical protein